MYKRWVCTLQNNENSTVPRNWASLAHYLCVVELQHFQQVVKQGGTLLQDWLAGRFAGIGLQQIESLFHQKRICVNGEPALPSTLLHMGDHVALVRRHVGEILPQKLPLSIVHEDEDLLVVDKAAGMPVHPGLGHYRGTLLHALAYHYQQTNQTHALLREAVVHRLDKDTSGIMVLAKNTLAKQRLDAQFRSANIHRHYEAWVWGKVQHDEGLIDLAVGRLPGEKYAIGADLTGTWGKPAATRYKTIKRLEDRSFVHLFPLTGRTHQLRIHLHNLGHPILGDNRYALSHFPIADRLYLHARAITLIHPTRLERCHWQSNSIFDKYF